MLYNSHKDRVQVTECLFWYYRLITRVVLDKGPLNGLLLLLLLIYHNAVYQNCQQCLVSYCTNQFGVVQPYHMSHQDARHTICHFSFEYVYLLVCVTVHSDMVCEILVLHCDSDGQML